MKQWIKMWIETLNDARMGQLTDRLWRRATECFLLAGQQDSDGTLPALADMAWSLRLSVDELRADLEALREAGLLRLEGDRWFVINFAKRQAPSTSTERSRAHRERQRETDYYENEPSDEPEITPSEPSDRPKIGPGGATQVEPSSNASATRMQRSVPQKRREEKRKPEEKRRERAPPRAAEDPPVPLPELWSRALAELKAINAKLYGDWLGSSALLALEDGRARVQVRDDYAVEWCGGRLKLPIQRALSGAMGRPVGELVEIEFTTREA